VGASTLACVGEVEGGGGREGGKVEAKRKREDIPTHWPSREIIALSSF
jgi:hypothetical protein